MNGIFYLLIKIIKILFQIISDNVSEVLVLQKLQ